jgi:hypothetical protein
LAVGTAPEIQTLFADDFSAPLSTADWDFNRFASGGSFYGRTQQRQSLPTVSDGLLHLELDTYNPTARTPGDSFVGSEIISTQTFTTDTGGVAFEVSARIASPIAGLVGGLFLYNASPHSEIDFELLGNDAAAGRSREETNIYSNEPLGVGHPLFVSSADPTSFHTYRVEWFPTVVRWFVDGQLAREDTTHVPQGALALHLNIWAPTTDWPDAYSASLQPATTSSANTSYFVDVDSVRVARLDRTAPIEPQSTLPVLIDGTATISTSFLWSFDDVSGPDQVTYSVLTAPIHGTLLLDGSATSTFTQADIDNGRVQYRENGDVTLNDGFTFTVSDAAGNHTQAEFYKIAIVNTAAPVIDANGILPASINSAATIWKDVLCTVALGNEPADLKYSVKVGPTHGVLLVNGVQATSFTQAEIDDHRVQYRNNGDAATRDSFTFQASDAAGDLTPVTTFNVAISNGVQAPGDDRSTATFSSAPEEISHSALLFDQSTTSLGASTSVGSSVNSDNNAGAAVSDGMGAANLALLGQYVAAGFATVPDQGGGTLVTQVPTQISASDLALLAIPQH